MSGPQRPVADIDWDTIERVADQGEVSRLESLSPEELDRELRAVGILPEHVDRMAQAALAKADDLEGGRTGRSS